jgi:prepilin-type N-terminal cleavage/methylation domain-containing protein
MTKNPRAGVTLIEILIAVTLLSMLSVGMLMAMRIGFNTMEKTDAHLVQNRRVANARKIIENEIAGFVFTRAEWQPKPDQFVSMVFNQWEPQTMRFVTAYSLQDAWRGRPQIAVLQVIPGERNAGVRLIVNETPYTGARQAGAMITAVEQDAKTGVSMVRYAPAIAGTQSFVLADKLAYCRFRYLEPRPEPPLRLWRPDWALQRLPLGVRIEMAPLENTLSELHVTTVTMPLTVNRDWGFYADGQ